jgi:hypothetical protein
MKWLQEVETHVLENVDATHHDRLQAAMIHACLQCLPKKEKKHKHWYKPYAHILNPRVRWRNTCMGNWNKQQGRSALLVTEVEKQDAVRACNQQMRKHRALHIVQEALAVEKAMNSNWTKPAWEKLIQFRQDFGNKQKVKKVTRLKFSNGNVSKSVAEDLQAFKSHIENLFKLPTHDETALELLDRRPELKGMDDLPDAT